MFRARRRASGLACAGAVALSVTPAVAGATPLGTTVVPRVLPVLGVGTTGKPTFISPDGTTIAGIVGQDGGTQRAVRWTASGVQRIDSPNATASTPTAVNDRGEIAGFESIAGKPTVGFLSFPGRPSSVLTSGAANLLPIALNDEGDLAVLSFGQSLTLGTLRHGAYRSITTLTGQPGSIDIDRAGDIAFFDPGPTGAPTLQLWQAATGALVSLTAPGDQTLAGLDAFSASGIVVANTTTATGGHDMAVWYPANYSRPVPIRGSAGQQFTYEPLGGVGFGTPGQAVNDKGQVVGTTWVKGVTDAFVWSAGSLRIYPGSAQTAPVFTAINDGGVIGGTLLDRSTVSEPAVWVGNQVLHLAGPGFSSLTELSDAGSAIGQVITFDLATGAEIVRAMEWTVQTGS